MKLLKFAAFILFAISVFQKVAGDKALEMWFYRLDVPGNLVQLVMGNLDLIFILGCAVIVHRRIWRPLGGRK